MVEFALAGLLFLGIIVALFESARLVGSYIALGNAAREGARAGLYAVSSSSTTCAPAPAFIPPLSVYCLDEAIRYKVRATLHPWMNVPDSAITICRRTNASAPCGTTAVSGSLVDVTVTWTFQLVPFASGWLGQRSGLPLTAYHRARID
jgi:hypothetical protein